MKKLLVVSCLGDETALFLLWGAFNAAVTHSVASVLSQNERLHSLPTSDEDFMRGRSSVSEATLSKHWCIGADVHKFIGERERESRRKGERTA
jgi:hypothetical protein